MKEVVCIKKGPWKNNLGVATAYGPKFNEICTVIAEKGLLGKEAPTYYVLEKYNGLWNTRHFVDLVSDDQLEKDLQLKPVTHDDRSRGVHSSSQ